MPWLKWHPYLSRDAGSRWQSLTSQQRGMFFELYCWAATCEPRGCLRKHGEPLTIEELARIDHSITLETFKAEMDVLLDLKLIERTDLGMYHFPRWNAHQRKGPARRRGNIGAELGQEGGREVEVEEDEEGEVEEKEKGAALPPVLDVPAFHEAWADWMEYRKQGRRKTYTPLGLKRLMNKLGRWAEEYDLPAVVDSINLSIENNWQGLFEPKANGGHDGRSIRGNRSGQSGPPIHNGFRPAEKLPQH